MKREEGLAGFLFPIFFARRNTASKPDADKEQRRASAAAHGIGDVRGSCEAAQAAVAQPVERVLGKDEVMGPIPISSSYVGRGRTSL